MSGNVTRPLDDRTPFISTEISRLIKASSPSTRTAVYGGQFELVDPCYDLQRRIMEDSNYDGMFMKDDNGAFLTQGAFRVWDFRNASAVAWHTEQVTGYFADATGVDAVFFDEGDAFACQYDCNLHKTCKSMPNALEWHKGAVQAWVGAAKIMAAKGKRAILSSQNAFKNSSPELWKEDNGTPQGKCPLKEDTVVAAMAAEDTPAVGDRAPLPRHPSALGELAALGDAAAPACGLPPPCVNFLTISVEIDHFGHFFPRFFSFYPNLTGRKRAHRYTRQS